MALTERDKIVLGKLRANYYLKPEEGRFYRKRDDRPVKGYLRDKKDRYMRMDFYINGILVHCYYHHAVWLYNYGDLPEILDHIDGNPLNNRVSNLRAVTRSENKLNSVYQWKPNKDTGLPGVYIMKDRVKKFRVKPRNKDYYFYDKYEAFYWVMFVGRFYREPTPSPSRGGGEETQGRNE
jgi:hypothetical protein